MPTALNRAQFHYNILISQAADGPPPTVRGGNCAAVFQGEKIMELPKLDIETLPMMEQAVGLFGSLASGPSRGGMDDRIVILMTWVYEVAPPSGIFG